MTTFYVRPIDPNTRLRSFHNTVGGYTRGDLGPNNLIEGDEVWVAMQGDVLEAGQMPGDKWLHVTKIDGQAAVGWVSIIHGSAEISRFVDEPTEEPPVDFETSIIIEIKGQRAEYVFSRKLS